MRKINLPLILDTAFTGVCAFLLFFTSLRYYTRNVYIALAFAITACILFGCLAFFYISKKQNKKLIISDEEKQKKLLALHLSLSSDEYVLNLFKEGLKSEQFMPVIHGKKLYLKDKICFFYFKMQAVSEDEIANIIKYNTNKTKALYCCKIAPDANTLAKNFMIEIMTVDSIYSLLNEKKLLPEKYVYEEPPKQKLRQKIKAHFSRRLCAPLFWSGAALLALSYFTFFPIYYIISGGIMLILSAITLVLN